MPSSPDIMAEYAIERSELEPVPKSDLKDWWPAILAPLSRLLEERNEYRPVDILDALENDTMQLWASGESFVVTQVGGYPTLKVLTVLFAGGDLGAIRRHMGDLEAWARDRNCNRIRVHGRPGWERVFHMERIGVVLEKEL